MIKEIDPVPNAPQKENLPFRETSIYPFEEPTVSFQATSHISEETTTLAEARTRLKLVSSTAVSEPLYKSIPSQRDYFMAEIRKRSPYDFVMIARDPFHYLNCELPLELEESKEGRKPSLICQFAAICEEELVDFIEDDEDLLGMTLISFQMQIIKTLFAFCTAQNVENLIIKATEEQLANLGIYDDFIKYVDKTPTNQGMDVEIIIPVHYNSPTECEEFIDNMMAQFRKTLWEKQSTNSAIRNYLKANVRLSIVAETLGNADVHKVDKLG